VAEKSVTLRSVRGSFRLFVYGTLKRGGSARELLSKDVRESSPSTVHGRLFLHPSGYPVLSVPETTVLAEGTADTAVDLAAQGSRLDCSVPHVPGWPLIEGELLTLADPGKWLPALDEYEGFEAGRPSLYRRVLVPVRSVRSVAAWAYVAGSTTSGLELLAGRSWPAG
jgi:gamma-glutamylcyclotransferase (GGCT)/AIG2-like uncharacterized protein YtfP